MQVTEWQHRQPALDWCNWLNRWQYELQFSCILQKWPTQTRNTGQQLFNLINNNSVWFKLLSYKCLCKCSCCPASLGTVLFPPHAYGKNAVINTLTLIQPETMQTHWATLRCHSCLESRCLCLFPGESHSLGVFLGSVSPVWPWLLCYSPESHNFSV